MREEEEECLSEDPAEDNCPTTSGMVSNDFSGPKIPGYVFPFFSFFGHSQFYSLNGIFSRFS